MIEDKPVIGEFLLQQLEGIIAVRCHVHDVDIGIAQNIRFPEPMLELAVKVAGRTGRKVEFNALEHIRCQSVKKTGSTESVQVVMRK